MTSDETNKPSREMTLDEYVAKLYTGHAAAKELAALRADHKRLDEEWMRMYAGRECPNCGKHVTMNVEGGRYNEHFAEAMSQLRDWFNRHIAVLGSPPPFHRFGAVPPRVEKEEKTEADTVREVGRQASFESFKKIGPAWCEACSSMYYATHGHGRYCEAHSKMIAEAMSKRGGERIIKEHRKRQEAQEGVADQLVKSDVPELPPEGRTRLCFFRHDQGNERGRIVRLLPVRLHHDGRVSIGLEGSEEPITLGTFLESLTGYFLPDNMLIPAL